MTVSDSADTDIAPLTRSPIFVLTLAFGVLVGAVGWMFATVMVRSTLAFGTDLRSLMSHLPEWLQDVPSLGASLGTIGVFAGLHVLALRRRSLRNLLVGYGAAASGAAVSFGAAVAIVAVSEPSIATRFEDPGLEAGRSLATDPAVAAAVAVLVVTRRSIEPRLRRSVYRVAPWWLLANFAARTDPPYVGGILDVGIGMVMASVIALAVKTRSLQATRSQIIEGMAHSGIRLRSAHPAAVDARGSRPWMATTEDGRHLFIKALSTEQRGADLLFRGIRWLRLRRTGDGPPEASLRRSAEHEALVSHHVRGLGIRTPRAIAVADIASENIALVYEAMDGRSLDKVPVEQIDDKILGEIWAMVTVLRAHGVAHRDLRLANLFLCANGEVALIDFGFAELASNRHLLDTDVAELLAATASVVGVDRALGAALSVVGSEVVGSACEWLHPLGLSSATRRAIGQRRLLAELRQTAQRSAGVAIVEYEPLSRLNLVYALGPAIVLVGGVVIITAVIGVDTLDALQRVRWQLLPVIAFLGIASIFASAMALRTAAEGRLRLAEAVTTTLAGGLPTGPGTGWSHRLATVNRRLGSLGLSEPTSVAISARWCAAGMVQTPVLIASVAAWSMRDARTPSVSIAIGVGVGIAYAAAQLLALSTAEWGREFISTLLDESRLTSPGAPRALAVLGWTSIASLLAAVAIVPAATATDMDIEPSLLILFALLVAAAREFLPSRRGIGMIEIVLFVVVGSRSSFTEALLVVVLYRLLAHWLPVTFGLVGRRTGWASRPT